MDSKFDDYRFYTDFRPATGSGFSHLGVQTKTKSGFDSSDKPDPDPTKMHEYR